MSRTERISGHLQELKDELKEEKADSERFALICAIFCLPLNAQRALVERGRNGTDREMRSLCERLVVSDVPPMALEEAEQVLISSNSPYYARVYRQKIAPKADIDTQPERKSE
jgi:hypothetical protein